MSPESAEMTKYVANALLSTKISFINEIANLCEHMEADINDVRRGIGHDSRIGFAFLFPGVGYGGSCFPKDVRALQSMARTSTSSRASWRGRRRETPETGVAREDHEVLRRQLEREDDRRLGPGLQAVHGRHSRGPALVLIDRLLADGAKLHVHDPEAMENVRHDYGDRLSYAEHPYDALDGADALAIVTEWKQFLRPDLEEMRKRMKTPIIF